MWLFSTVQHPDGRQMQMNLTGFLNAKNARTFIQDLWELLLSAQENIGGIPAVFLEQKKEEIKLRQVMRICSVLTVYRSVHVRSEKIFHFSHSELYIFRNFSSDVIYTLV